jgi:hypothetical protein
VTHHTKGCPAVFSISIAAVPKQLPAFIPPLQCARVGWLNHTAPTLCRVSDTPHEGLPSSFRVSIAAMPTQLSAAFKLRRPSSPTIDSITTVPGWSGNTLAVTVSPSPCSKPLAASQGGVVANRRQLVRVHLVRREWAAAALKLTQCRLEHLFKFRNKLLLCHLHPVSN